MHICDLSLSFYFLPDFSNTEVLSIRIVQGNRVSVPLGSRVQLDCTLNCTCEGTTQMDWRREGGGSLPDSAVVTRSTSGRTVTLVYEEATLDVAGGYECTTTWNSQTDTKSVTLEITA